jgi:hypothetical protein
MSCSILEDFKTGICIACCLIAPQKNVGIVVKDHMFAIVAIETKKK